MAAPLYHTTFTTPPVATRPRLRVVEGGRSEAALSRRRTYRRRRIVAAVLAATTLVVGVRAAQALGASVLGDGARTVSVGADATESELVPAAGATAEPVATAGTYRVRSGDTLWSIAAELGGDADVRELVDELSRRTGGQPLQPGQRIDLAGLPGFDD